MKKIKNILALALILTLLSGCSLEIPTNSAAAQSKDKKEDYSQINVSNSHDVVLKDGELNVIFLDVSQGSAVLLVGPSGDKTDKNGKTGHKTMLIDGGNNDKEKVMLEYLKRFGVDKIDILINTHPDADHSGGLDAVVSHVPVEKVYMPKVTSNTKTFESLLTAIKNKGLKITTAKAGVKLDWDPAVQVEMVAPVKDKYKEKNDYSVVLKLKYKDRSVLLTGDAEFVSENDMMDSGKDLSADLLLVSHHGSAGASSAKFLRAVHPQYGVIQVGKDNKYGHPTEKALQRLKKQGVKVFRNDLDGTVIASTDGKQWTISTDK